eukprot:gene5370-7287_t
MQAATQAPCKRPVPEMREGAMRLAWRNLADGVVARALQGPAVPALLAGRVVLSYGRLAELVQRCTVHLAASGVQPDEVAGVALPTGAPSIVLVLGLFLDIYWGGALGMWAVALLVAYAVTLAMRNMMTGQSRPTTVMPAYQAHIIGRLS